MYHLEFYFQFHISWIIFMKSLVMQEKSIVKLAGLTLNTLKLQFFYSVNSRKWKKLGALFTTLRCIQNSNVSFCNLSRWQHLYYYFSNIGDTLTSAASSVWSIPGMIVIKQQQFNSGTKREEAGISQINFETLNLLAKYFFS